MKIEKGIKKAPRTSKCTKYKFDNMGKGDSFIVKEDDRSKVASACSYYGSSHNIKFSIGRDMQGNLRCWRDE